MPFFNNKLEEGKKKDDKKKESQNESVIVFQGHFPHGSSVRTFCHYG